MSGHQVPARMAPKAHILAKNDNRIGFDLARLERRSPAVAKSMIGGMLESEKDLRSEEGVLLPKCLGGGTTGPSDSD